MTAASLSARRRQFNGGGGRESQQKRDQPAVVKATSHAAAAAAAEAWRDGGVAWKRLRGRLAWRGGEKEKREQHVSVGRRPRRDVGGRRRSAAGGGRKAGDRGVGAVGWLRVGSGEVGWFGRTLTVRRVPVALGWTGDAVAAAREGKKKKKRRENERDTRREMKEKKE